jgi:predicted transcriptional regulator
MHGRELPEVLVPRMNSLDREIDILESIAQARWPVSQRNLARIIGLSVGMTNSILKRLVHKGWLKVQKVNNRNIQYIISPQGMERIAKRSYLYLRRTIKNVVYYREAIEALVHELAQRDFAAVVLVGASDLDFIAERACSRNQLGFKRADSLEEAEKSERGDGRCFVLFSESIAPSTQLRPSGNREFLYRLLLTAHRSEAANPHEVGGLSLSVAASTPAFDTTEGRGKGTRAAEGTNAHG